MGVADNVACLANQAALKMIPKAANADWNLALVVVATEQSRSIGTPLLVTKRTKKAGEQHIIELPAN